MTNSKKITFFKIADSQYIFVKISWIGSWVSAIDWCKGHWCSSTHMATKLSDKSSKTGRKWIFCVFMPFLSFCRTASQPYGLSYINAIWINQFYLPKDQFMKFSQKILRIGDFEKLSVFELAILIFYASFPWKSVKKGSKFW